MEALHQALLMQSFRAPEISRATISREREVEVEVEVEVAGEGEGEGKGEREGEGEGEGEGKEPRVGVGDGREIRGRPYNSTCTLLKLTSREDGVWINGSLSITDRIQQDHQGWGGRASYSKLEISLQRGAP